MKTVKEKLSKGYSPADSPSAKPYLDDIPEGSVPAAPSTEEPKASASSAPEEEAQQEGPRRSKRTRAQISYVEKDSDDEEEEETAEPPAKRSKTGQEQTAAVEPASTKASRISRFSDLNKLKVRDWEERKFCS